MLELSPGIVTVIMIGGVVLGILTGYPAGAMVGGITLIMGYLLLGDATFTIIYSRIYQLTLNYPLLAIPLFTFMGVMVQRSGVSEGLFNAIYQWIGGLRGSLAISTVLFGTVLAACLGVITASVTMLTLICLPPMVKRGYSKSLAAGSVCAGGTLGILIPPSVMLVIYGPMACISVGKLFMAAIFPGLILCGLYCTYVAVRCFIRPEMGPAAPLEEREIPFIKKTAKLFTSLFPPAVLIIGVLGSILMGVAPPTEAASVGALASIILAIAYRKFGWKLLCDTVLETLKISSFIYFTGTMCFAFVGVFMSTGCGDVVANWILSAGGKWGAFGMVMFLVFIMGMVIDWIGILFIIVPIVSPIIPTLGFDPLWFGMMICINLQMAFMTPPVAASIFVCRGAVPAELEVSTADIIRGVTPFVVLIMVGIGFCIAFPQLILWLPAQMIQKW